jgi:hypothetical protein
MYKDGSYKAFSECADSLANACTNLRKNRSYSDQDARGAALNSCFAIARSAQLILNLLDSWAIGDEVIRQFIPQVLGLKTVTKEAVDYCGSTIDKTNKLAFVLLSQFQIENLLANILRELHLREPRGFYQLSKTIVDHFAIEKEAHDILYLPAAIRNSLHSNGIHKLPKSWADKRVRLDGVEYRFKLDSPVSCASWAHIAHALEHSIAVLSDILDAPEVNAINDPMFDHYTWHIVTQPEPV